MTSFRVDRMATLVDIYRRMTLIKQNDERFRAVIKAGKIVAPYYSPRGQEVIPAAVSVNLTDEDYICTIYRGIHDMLAKGVPLEALWAEIAGKVTGTCKGKGGPMHITHPASRRHGHDRHRRQQHADRKWPCARRADSWREARRGRVLRRRRLQHRRVPRVAQHGRGVEAAGRVRVPEQRLRRTHALRDRDLGREDLGSRRRLSDAGRDGRRQRSACRCMRRRSRRSSVRAPGRGRR